MAHILCHDKFHETPVWTEEKPSDWVDKPLSPEQLEVKKRVEELPKLRKLKEIYEEVELDPELVTLQVVQWRDATTVLYYLKRLHVVLSSDSVSFAGQYQAYQRAN